jgi:hypothetical protein
MPAHEMALFYYWEKSASHPRVAQTTRGDATIRGQLRLENTLTPLAAQTAVVVVGAATGTVVVGTEAAAAPATTLDLALGAAATADARVRMWNSPAPAATTTATDAITMPATAPLDRPVDVSARDFSQKCKYKYIYKVNL